MGRDSLWGIEPWLRRAVNVTLYTPTFSTLVLYLAGRLEIEICFGPYEQLEADREEKVNTMFKAPHYNWYGRGFKLRAAITIACQMAFVLFGYDQGVFGGQCADFQREEEVTEIYRYLGQSRFPRHVQSPSARPRRYNRFDL
jgi:hypothetical protein